MMFSRVSTAAILSAFSLAASPALADLSVDDAWAVWQAQARALGLSVTALETREGEALQLGKITFAAGLPMGLGSFALHMAGPRFEPLGDGTVRVVMPERSEIRLNATITGEAPITARFSYEMDGSRVIMRGDTDNVETLWTGTGARMTLTEMQPFADMGEELALEFSLSDYRFTNLTTRDGDLLSIAQNGAYDAFSYSLSMRDDETASGATLSETGSGTGWTFDQSLTLPAAGSSLLELHNAFRAGLRLVGQSRLERMESHQTLMLEGELIGSEDTVTEAYVTDLRLDEGGIDLTASTGRFDAAFFAVGLPVPLAIEGGAVTAGLEMPLLKADNPQGARLTMDISDLVLDDAVWALFDAQGQLPRDPLQVAFDSTAELQVNDELLDIVALMARDGFAGLIDPVSLRLNRFRLSGAGAEMRADGHFTFDREDTQTYPGIPRPDGIVGITLTGANGLIDRLVGMGLVGEDEAMGARMMMGMFMRPAEGEDVLSSEIQMTPEGHVLANGQRLK